MDEQCRQWDEDIYDDEAIARAYHDACAESCSASAILLAQADAYYVEHEIMEELVTHCPQVDYPCRRSILKPTPSSSPTTSCRKVQVVKQKRRILQRQNSPIAYAA